MNEENTSVLFRKVQKLFIFVLIIFFISSCDPGIFNPESYGKKREITFLWFNPNDLESLLVSKKGDFSEVVSEISNGTDYLVTWTTNDSVYTLSFTSYLDPINSAYFDGYDARDGQDEIPFQIEGNTYKLTSNKLLPTEGGLYRIFLSENLTK